MRELGIDIETYSSIDLTKSGVYRYVEAPDFTVLLLGYAFDDEPIKVLDLTKEELPQNLLDALTDENVIKTAFNAAFERTCLKKYLGINLPVEQWRCSMVACAELGLPQSLGQVAEALGLEVQKDTRGKALINYFSKPQKDGSRHLPSDDLEKWETYKEYNYRDVEVERAIKGKIAKFPMPEREQELWQLDQRINDRGVHVDLELAKKAVRLNAVHSDLCKEKAFQLTGIENVNSPAQLKQWIEEESGEVVDNLKKESVQNLLKTTESLKVKEVLKLRMQMAKTSVKKYETVLKCACNDATLHGMLQFYGANRSGRWAGRFVQVQNLPQNHIDDLDLARSIVLKGDYELLTMLYSNIPQLLSELIRTVFVPSKGRRFMVSDFSAIEARVLAYLANEEWRLEVFRTHGKIYEASAEKMFHLPAGSVKKGDPLRQKGKIAELALGYGGSCGALISMGALKMGLSEDELPQLVEDWRKSNPRVIQFWKDVNKAALDAVKGKPSVLSCGIGFIREAGILFVGLPSGRRLAYVQPRIEENKYGQDALTYMGLVNKKWERIETFGGKLVENLVQAVARDCLAESMMRLESRGFEINFHVHDEVILDVPIGVSSVEEIAEIMGEEIPWAKGLPLRADGYECSFYQKD